MPGRPAPDSATTAPVRPATAIFEVRPSGPYSLDSAQRYFGGWATFCPDPSALAMAFPVEGSRTSAAVVLRQGSDGCITGEVSGAGADAEIAWRQALAVLSLDEDGTGWPNVGERDSVIGALQATYLCLRPVLFHSPYEAAAAFIIGHRMTIRQGRAIRQAMAHALGDALPGGGDALHAFPRPQTLRELSSFPGVSPEKIERLHAVAQTALDGLLDRAYLRSLPVEQALRELQTLPGVGPFFSHGIVLRGAGLVDEPSDDDVTREAIQRSYELPQPPDQQAVLERSAPWCPYRTWANVLLHVWLRREAGGPHRPQRSPAKARR